MREDPLLDADEEHDGELETLRRVQRHQHDLVVVVEVVGVGDERHLFEELVEHRELAGGSDELAQVLDASVRLDRVLGLELAEVPGLLDRGLQEVAGTDAVGAGELAESVEQTDEGGDAAHGWAGDAGLVGAAHGVDERDRLGGRERIELGDARVADAALRHVQDPLDAHLVDRVDDRPQVCHRVLDLAPVVEAGAADDLVRHAEAHERLLDHAALRVGAVEDGDLAPVDGVVAVELGGRAGDPRRLVALVLGVVADDAVAAGRSRSTATSACVRGCWRSPRWRRRGSSACCGSSGRARSS